MTEEHSKINHEITAFRQPMVTSLGILMGFLLNFLASWAIGDDSKPSIQTTADWIVILVLFSGLILMIYVLFRLLNNHYDQRKAGEYYQLTFRFYIVSIVLAFAGLGVALFF